MCVVVEGLFRWCVSRRVSILSSFIIINGDSGGSSSSSGGDDPIARRCYPVRNDLYRLADELLGSKRDARFSVAPERYIHIVISVSMFTLWTLIHSFERIGLILLALQVKWRFPTTLSWTEKWLTSTTSATYTGGVISLICCQVLIRKWLFNIFW